jgi:hypothetical protein
MSQKHEQGDKHGADQKSVLRNAAYGSFAFG